MYQKADTLLAIKAIALSSALSAIDKRVGTALIDHFNRATGRCDPSLNGLAGLLGVSRRTVIRAISRLVGERMLRKVRHGGFSHRNSYEPIWRRFRELEAEWNERRKSRRGNTTSHGVSPLTGQTCHLAGGTDGTQTYPDNNLSSETFARLTRALPSIGTTGGVARLQAPGQANTGAASPQARGLLTKKFSAAANCEAERRWSAALHERYRGDTGLYAKAIAAIDPQLQLEATNAEVLRRGDGIAWILAELKNRGVPRAP